MGISQMVYGIMAIYVTGLVSHLFLGGEARLLYLTRMEQNTGMFHY